MIKQGRQKNYFLFYQHLSSLQNSIANRIETLYYFPACLQRCCLFVFLCRAEAIALHSVTALKLFPSEVKFRRPQNSWNHDWTPNPSSADSGLISSCLGFSEAQSSLLCGITFWVGRERSVLIILVGNVTDQLPSIQFLVKSRSKSSWYVLKTESTV